MERLNDYDDDAQQFIVNIGKFIYDKSKGYFDKKIQNGDMSCFKDFDINELRQKNELLNKINKDKDETINELKERIFLVRDEERNKTKHEYKDQIEYLKKTNEKLIITNEEREKNIKLEKESYAKLIQDECNELKDKCKKYQELYEKVGKGKKYESKLIDLFREFNKKQLNNIWEIKQVDSISKKTDFIFKNKYTKNSILLDAKNNNTSVTNTDVKKFIRDIRENKYVIGGVLLANGQIAGKTGYETEEVEGKKLIYVSNVDLDNVAFIFNQLDLIMMLNEEKLEVKNNTFKKYLINLYNADVEILKNINIQKENLIEKINHMKELFTEIFDEDIDIEHNKNEKYIKENKKIKKFTKNQNKKPVDEFNKEKWIKENITFEIDDNKKYQIIGEKSDFYLIYKKNGKEVLQYFKNESALKGKISRIYNDSKIDTKITVYKNKKIDKNGKLEITI